MKIGIVIPTFNSGNTLFRCLKSVEILKKNLSNSISIFPIVINDGSKDSSYKIAKYFLEKKVLFKIIQNKKNLGISNSRNIGIEKLLKTNFIFFLDSDDQIHLDFFRKIKKQKKEIDFNKIYAGSFIHKHNKSKEKISIFPKNINLNENDIKNYQLNYLIKPNRNRLISYCWGKLYPTNIIKKFKFVRFNKNLDIAEDLDFNSKIFNKSKGVIYINNNSYVYQTSYDKLENDTKEKIHYSLGKMTDINRYLKLILNLNSLQNFKIPNSYLKLDKIKNHCKVVIFIIHFIKSLYYLRSINDFIYLKNIIKNIFKKRKFQKIICDYDVEIADGNKLISFFLKKFNSTFFVLSCLLIYKIKYK